MSCVTARDCTAIRLVYESRFLTIEHARKRIYGNANVAQRRMAVLEKEGWLLSLPVSCGLRGQPTKAYYINWRKKNAIEAILGEELLSCNIPRTPPENALVTAHLLELNSVLIAFAAGASARGHFFRCIPEYCAMATPGGPIHPLTCKVRDPTNRSRMVGVRRDAVFCIGVGKNKALFELEYDRGREVVTSGGFRAVTLSRKIAIFMQGLKEQAFHRYCGPQFFNYPFRASRLLIVTSTTERMENLASVCQEQKTEGMVYLTTVEHVTPESVFDPIWVVPADGRNTNRALVGGS
jgi:hypothetical protein